jgi:hypothetical protein
MYFLRSSAAADGTRLDIPPLRFINMFNAYFLAELLYLHTSYLY